MQCVSDMVLRRSHHAATTVAAMQVQSAMTKITDLSHSKCGLGANIPGLQQALLPLGSVGSILKLTSTNALCHEFYALSVLSIL